MFWAAQISGLYFTPISVQFLTGEVRYIIKDCEAKLLIASRAQVAKAAGATPPQILLLEDWLAAIAGEPETLIADAAEGAEMLYSSGTTGQPKGVRAGRPGAALGTVSELFTRRLRLHDVTNDAVYLSTAPLYHSAPLRYNTMMHRCGATSVVMPRFDAQESLRLIEHHQVTHSQWVPTMFVRLLRLPENIRKRYELSTHRIAIHAAAPCPIAIKEEMLNWWGLIVYEYYSGTEGNGQTAIAPAEWLSHKGSVGRPILGEVHIMGPTGTELPAGETGQVYFSGGPQFEYFKDPVKTARAYNTRGWSTLGDIGCVDEAGYLYLSDRASHMIITGGVNVYPREVEDILLSHPDVLDAAVFGIPDPEFGEAVQAAVELCSGADLDAAELIEFSRAHLAHLKCPRGVDFHKQLPRHQTGKLYKEILKAPYWAREETKNDS